MKLTGILKKMVAEAETIEEKKFLIEGAGFELTDDELKSVVDRNDCDDHIFVSPGTSHELWELYGLSPRS